MPFVPGHHPLEPKLGRVVILLGGGGLVEAYYDKGRQVLFIAGKRDEIVPPSATERLWKAAGEPKIVWYDCTHYGAAFYIVPAMEQVVKHLLPKK